MRSFPVFYFHRGQITAVTVRLPVWIGAGPQAGVGFAQELFQRHVVYAESR